MSSGRQIADVIGRTLWICDRHALRLEWVMAEVKSLFPLSAKVFENLAPAEVAGKNHESPCYSWSAAPFMALSSRTTK